MAEKSLLVSWGLAAVGALAGGFFGGFIGHFGDQLADLTVEKFWNQAPAVTFDFQSVLGCPSGRLSVMKERMDDVRLTNGASELIICDHEALTTSRPEGARDLAAKYRGCLKWIDGELVLLRASKAVCALPGNRGFVCDGQIGREHGGSQTLGIEQQVAACSPEQTSKFGFR